MGVCTMNNFIKNLKDILVYKVIYLPWVKKIYRLEKKEEEETPQFIQQNTIQI